MRSPIQLFAVIAFGLAAATVAAQVYKWVDKDGKTQYTDTPPPASATKTDAKKITINTGVAAPAAAAPAAKGAVDKAKDVEKRKADDAKTAKKAEDDQKTAAANAEQCSAAKRAIASLETGAPMMTTSETGERTILSDENRAKDLARARTVAAEACKS